MSSFVVPVVRVRGVEPIPNADAIELAMAGDYRSVVKKGQFTTGGIAVYLPDGYHYPPRVPQHQGSATTTSSPSGGPVGQAAVDGLI